MHVVGPQLGLTMPGITVVCGDSHTSTHGAFGAMAFGIGTSEVEHVLATQTLPLTPFKTMAITVNGHLRDGVTAKDIILAVIAKISTGGGVFCAHESELALGLTSRGLDVCPKHGSASFHRIQGLEEAPATQPQMWYSALAVPAGTRGGTRSLPLA